MLIVAFTDITTSSFVNTINLADGTSIGGGTTATSSILYLILPVIWFWQFEWSLSVPWLWLKMPGALS